jgi:hypothetical protein
VSVNAPAGHLSDQRGRRKAVQGVGTFQASPHAGPVIDVQPEGMRRANPAFLLTFGGVECLHLVCCGGIVTDKTV